MLCVDDARVLFGCESLPTGKSEAGAGVEESGRAREVCFSEEVAAELIASRQVA